MNIEPAIEVKNIGKKFKVYERKKGKFEFTRTLLTRKYKIVKALKNVDFEIQPGEFVGVIGPNGAGKSTLIKILTGVLTPSEGDTKVLGIVPYKNRHKNSRNVGVVFGQRTQLWWDLPVKDSFQLLKSVFAIPEKDFQRRFRKFSRVLGIDKYMDKPVRKLSLGERMRCDLAASMMHDPQVVYLDEPTIGLDVEAKHRIREFLKETNKKGKTIILTTHDMGDIEELCPRMIIIDKGTKIYDGPTDDIKKKSTKERVVIFDFKGKPPKIRKTKGIKEIAREGDKILVKVDITKTSVSTIIKKILAKYEVDDITIEEPSIEELIRKIYAEGV
jgi:ABC-2 type transport system ATP-binding protein